MTHTDTNPDDPTSDDEERPERQCVAVAEATGERCQREPIPGAEHCHSHVDYAEFAKSVGGEPMTAATPEDAGGTPPLRHENPGSDREKMRTPTTGTGVQTPHTAKNGGSAVQKMENASK